MPRLAFEEPKGRPRPKHHRRETAERSRESKRDGVVLALKAATFVIVAGLIGAVVLLVTNSGGEEDTAGQSPAVPTIESSGRSAPPTTSPTTTPPTTLVPPVVRSETAQLVPVQPPASTPPSPTQPPPTSPDSRFAVIGEPCEEPGTYSLTARYEPVICGSDQPSQPPTWHSMF